MRFLRLIDKYLILSISFKKNKNAHLALGVIGDHYFMGNPPMFANIERHIRNIFIGNVPKIPEEKRKQYISSVDMAQTILQASGAYWGSSKFGLGTSIFSKDITILFVDIRSLFLVPSSFNGISSYVIFLVVLSKVSVLFKI